MDFRNFIDKKLLSEAPMPPMGGAPGGISSPGSFGGGMGGGMPPMPAPPMGGMGGLGGGMGGLGGGLGGPPMGGGDPNGQQKAMQLEPDNVWDALEQELGMSDKDKQKQQQEKKPDHLMS